MSIKKRTIGTLMIAVPTSVLLIVNVYQVYGFHAVILAIVGGIYWSYASSLIMSDE